MSTIIYQIAIILNSLLGAGNHYAQAQSIYAAGDYKVQCGVVIIDTDEL